MMRRELSHLERTRPRGQYSTQASAMAAVEDYRQWLIRALETNDIVDTTRFRIWSTRSDRWFVVETDRKSPAALAHDRELAELFRNAIRFHDPDRVVTDAELDTLSSSLDARRT